MNGQVPKMTEYEIAMLLLRLASSGIQAALRLRQTAVQDKEWTTDQEIDFDSKVADIQAGQVPHWLVEPDPVVTPPTPPTGEPP